MRAQFLLGMLPAVLSAAGLRIDHVTIAGTNLEQMRANLASIGIASVYGGAHTNHATEMALVSFPDGSYLELMGIQRNADPAAVEHHVWSKQLRGNAGPCAWAVSAQDMAAELARLKAAGIATGSPERAGRERPDGVRLDWETADVGGEARGSFFPFLIHDFTPRAQRAFPEGKAVTRAFSGIRNVVIAVRNLNDAVKLYRQAYGLAEPLQQVDKDFGAHLAFFGTAPVILAQPLTADTWIAARIDRFGEGPCAAVLGGSRGVKAPIKSRSRWLAAEIQWADDTRLGWHLGFTN